LHVFATRQHHRSLTEGIAAIGSPHIEEKEMIIEGGCHCRTLRYVIAQDTLTDVANCHCSICRRTSGGTFMTWATIPLEAFRWERGVPSVYQATPQSERYFCSTCGAQLAMHTSLAPKAIDVTVATFDRPELFPPNRNIWVGSKLSWVMLEPDLPQEIEEVL
jgi:hypothetical protein